MPLPFVLVVALAPKSAAPIELRPGIVLTKSVKVTRKTYRFATAQGEKQAGGETIPTLTPAIVIRGDGITIDFAGATLQGSAERTDPDKRKGLAVQVEGNNVTLKNLNVHGYKVGLIARNAKGLRILDSDFSNNWKQKLASTIEKEDESDWMSYHHNENDEWLRYGAAIYLSGCDRFEVKGVRAQGGQCGLMLNRSTHGTVWNNDFSFLSGVGLGLYRSSDNRVMHNRIDWCVRGFSYGVYNRGQDSAGILIFEQCNRNVFAYNSVTHGGDGFFLWAGQTTMDAGTGGCNDNLLYGNDFSHAPTNGIEATFSRNTFANNKVMECWHGVWGGYSYDTKILGNVFGYNAESIAIEHGQKNEITSNVFFRDNMGLDLWMNASQDPNWGYPKHHDTVSHDYKIQANLFSDIPTTAIRVRDTHEVDIDQNNFFRVGRVLQITQKGKDVARPGLEGGSEEEKEESGVEFGANAVRSVKAEPALEGFKSVQYDPSFRPLPPTMEASGRPIVELDPDPKQYISRFDVRWEPVWLDLPVTSKNLQDIYWSRTAMDTRTLAPKPMTGGRIPFIPKGTLRGQRYILVDEWGPYDFKRPLLWPRQDLNPGVTGNVTRKRYEILGPKGRWRLLSSDGVSHVSAQSGSVPGYVDVEMKVGQVGTTKIEMEYVGAATSDYRGVVTPAGKPVRFGFSRFFAPIAWNVKFFRWSESENPAEPHANPKNFAQVLESAPIKELKTDRLDYAGYALVRGLPNDHYATLGEGTFSVPAGEYDVALTTDDGARLWLDGKPLIADAWKYQGPTLYTKRVHLGAGPHTMRVEHFQIDGYATLKVELKPAK
ncbi:right-handed parallel beta-helix repeat-containing protein [Fimbriimonas ginsengisoli]|uniref:PKD domain containing protein n=1 Tax=Fimbriimonas ginsengisoli Gsoil 348 TaxID=661478 RepID=A0A068NM82_FIMGI|nr:right-handed parallel beta-helix repeat-containing protein [Fimbriimonas ginsengisoli]AIE84546.1 PKD domain containing protein [Fimbriimonas ginsengisoli Gsoil 348]